MSVLQDTKIGVSQVQEREWVERQQAAEGSSPAGGYHFICEVFFMTLQVRKGCLAQSRFLVLALSPALRCMWYCWGPISTCWGLNQ